jgi:subtilisin family serine protease
MRPGVIGGLWAAVIAAMLACAAFAAGAPRGPGEKLSPRLAALAKSPELRSAPARKQAARLDVAPQGEGSLLRYGERLVVEVRFAGGAQEGADELRAAGAQVLGVSPRYSIVTAAVAVASLREVAQAPGVEAVMEQLTPATSEVGLVAGGGGCPEAITSEGDLQLNARPGRTKYGIAGKGVDVGILSDSFDTASGTVTDAGDDVASGDLPGPGNPCGRTSPVDVLQDLPASDDPSDEGRAMAQLVHDLAPRSRLVFATGFTGLGPMAENIRRLEKAGAEVIVDDITYPQEPFFQAGPIDNAIEDVTDKGVVYFSSAGNSNAPRPNSQFGSWETREFRPTGDCPALSLPQQAEDCLDFEPAEGGGASLDRGYQATVANGGRLQVIMQWAEPWSGVDTDLDLYLVDSTNEVLTASTDDNIGHTQRPYESWSWTNNTGSPQDVRMVVNRAVGTGTPRVKLRDASSSGITFNEYASPDEPDIAGPTIMGHNGAVDALSVAAVRYDDDNMLEPFSSHGPVTHYFKPVDGDSPAGPRSPLVLDKPDIAATDGAQTTFFGAPPMHRFFGTSAAAPHAAAVAALQLDATPSATPTQIANAQMNTARPVGDFGMLEAGAGLVDALAAVEQDNAGPKTKLDQHPKKRKKKKKARFEFHAEARASYECKLDKKPWKACVSPESYKVKRGLHHFRVRATDQLGNSGPIKKFKWRRVER